MILFLAYVLEYNQVKKKVKQIVYNYNINHVISYQINPLNHKLIVEISYS